MRCFNKKLTIKTAKFQNKTHSLTESIYLYSKNFVYNYTISYNWAQHRDQICFKTNIHRKLLAWKSISEFVDYL